MGFTLPSPTSPSTQAQALIAKKSQIQSEIQSHISILRANNIDMTTPLVDSEGFPRADVDIYAVRKARVRIIELRNDLRDVMDEIGKALEEVYARPEGSAADAAGGSKNNNGNNGQEQELVPFARVDGVAPASPAAEAGLQREDLILKFGSLVKSSFSSPSSLTPLATLVSQNENVSPLPPCFPLTDFRHAETHRYTHSSLKRTEMADSNTETRMGWTWYVRVSLVFSYSRRSTIPLTFYKGAILYHIPDNDRVHLPSHSLVGAVCPLYFYAYKPCQRSAPNYETTIQITFPS